MLKKYKKIKKEERKKIVEYWSKIEDESDLSVDWADAHERCWRCGYESRLYKCHIIPDSCGGKFEPSNLVLLCRRCHREAPNVTDPKFMWICAQSGALRYFFDYSWY